jgi:hypothetical protein
MVFCRYVHNIFVNIVSDFCRIPPRHDAYMSFSTANLNDRDIFPVEKRAAMVFKQYLTAARDVDQNFHKSKRGEVGPIEAKLLECDARDKPSRALLLILFSALLAGFPTAATAHARPAQGWALPAS